MKNFLGRYPVTISDRIAIIRLNLNIDGNTLLKLTFLKSIFEEIVDNYMWTNSHFKDLSFSSFTTLTRSAFLMECYKYIWSFLTRKMISNNEQFRANRIDQFQQKFQYIKRNVYSYRKKSPLSNIHYLDTCKYKPHL